ncbi:MAG: molecular chaperone DnaJ [Lachnospiraceae bacterium]|nr:molecular chaperone DnaJ [Lachnospiraceae bacterium]
MAKYFKNVKSFDDLKNQFKALAKKNHPDAGGDVETMKEINCEYDALFVIWKDRYNAESPNNRTDETAESTRQQFYTEFGWEGNNHDWNRSLKEIAQIVRAYVKDKYPTYKFGVRTSYASMCQELHVELKESPVAVYKTYEALTAEDKNRLINKYMHNNFWTLNSWSEEEEKDEIMRIWAEHGNFYKCLNELTQAVIDDVDNFVNSYNYSDCDGMQDYFHVDFYYFGCARNNGNNIKVVPKTARIAKQETAPAEPAPKPAQAQEATPEIEKTGYNYKITRGEDTRDGSELWIVRIAESLDRAAYIAENNRMKELGGYYSKFKHGFIFRYDPSEKLPA